MAYAQTGSIKLVEEHSWDQAGIAFRFVTYLRYRVAPAAEIFRKSAQSFARFSLEIWRAMWEK